MMAVRKDTREPTNKLLKRGDLFEIVIIQIKGGSARQPTKDDCLRLREVARVYRAKKIVLFQWRKGGSARFFVLGRQNIWVPSSSEEIFG